MAYSSWQAVARGIPDPEPVAPPPVPTARGGIQAAGTRASTAPVVRTGSQRQGGYSLGDAFRDVVPQGVRDVAGRALRDTYEQVQSGENLLNELVPGQDVGTLGLNQVRRIPKVGPTLATALDIGLAPATIGAAGIGPGAAASFKTLPLAARIPLNIAAPASRSASFGTRLAAETAIGTGATVGAQEAAERTDNPLLIAGAGLGAGILASGGVTAAPKVGRGLKKGATAYRDLTENIPVGMSVKRASDDAFAEAERVAGVQPTQGGFPGMARDVQVNAGDQGAQGALPIGAGTRPVEDLPLFKPGDGTTLQAQIVPRGILPGPVRATVRSAHEQGVRRGRLLNLRGEEQLGPDFTQKQVTDVLNDAKHQVDSATTSLNADVDLGARGLGKTFKGKDGNTYLRGVTDQWGEPAMLRDVLEFPEMYPLTPEQASAAQRISKAIADAREEARLAGVADLRSTELEMGQNYIPRKVQTERKGGPGGGSRLATTKQGYRELADPFQEISQARFGKPYDSLDAAGRAEVRASVVYENPLDTAKSYIRFNLDNAASTHAARLHLTARDAKGMPEAVVTVSRHNEELAQKVQGIRQRMAGLSQTVRNQEVRGTAQEGEARRAASRYTKTYERADSALGRFFNLEARHTTTTVTGDLPTSAVTRRRNLAALPSIESIEKRIASLSKQVERGKDGQPLRNKANTARMERMGRLYAQADVREAIGDSAVGRDLADALEPARARLGNYLAGDAAPAGSSVRAPAFGSPERAAWEADRAAFGAQQQRGGQVNYRGEQPPASAHEPAAVLRAHEAALERLANTLRTTERMSDPEGVVKAAEREYRILAREVRRSSRSARTTAKRAGSTWERQNKKIAELNALRTELDDLKGKYKGEQINAAKLPEGRGRVENAPLLQAYDFPEDSAKVLSRYYSNGTYGGGRLGQGVKAIRTASKNIVPLRAIGDASALLRQLRLMAPSHPITFVKNTGLSFRDAFWPGGEAHYQQWLASPDVREAGKYVTLQGGSSGSQDFMASWLDRMPVLGPTQRQFASVGNRNRVDVLRMDADMLRRTGQRVDEAVLEQVGRNTDRITGVSRSRASDLETFTEFAPNWMRSRLSVLTRSLTDGSVEGQLARQYLKNYATTGLLMVGGAALAADRNLGEVLNPLTVDSEGRWRLNPNFGTVRARGRDYNVFGDYIDLARLAVLASDGAVGAIRERDLVELANPIIYAARTKGAPWITMSADIGSGENIVGSDARSWEYVLASGAPITAGQVAHTIIEGQSPESVAVGGVTNFLGGSSNPLSARERVELGQYGELKGTKQLDAHRSQAWQDIASGFGIEGYTSYGRWRTDQIKALTRELRTTGLSQAESVRRAEAAVDKMPQSKAYSTLRNGLEDMWAVENPKEAAKELDRESELPEKERFFNPSKSVRDYVEASR